MDSKRFTLHPRHGRRVSCAHQPDSNHQRPVAGLQSIDAVRGLPAPYPLTTDN